MSEQFEVSEPPSLQTFKRISHTGIVQLESLGAFFIAMKNPNVEWEIKVDPDAEDRGDVLDALADLLIDIYQRKASEAGVPL